MVLDETTTQNLRDCFQSIFECEKKIEALKEQTKVFNQSIKETFENVAEIMELDPKDKDGKKALVAGYKEYLASITDPQFMETKDEVFALIKSQDFLGIEKLKG